METIEQLKLENGKLTERLNNAAKFFREQKAQIESLTKENEELKDKISRTPQEEVISTEKWNALVTEKENLNEQLKDKDVEITNQKDALQSCYNQLHDYEMMNNDLLKKTENLNNQCNEYELKVQKIEQDYNESIKTCKELSSEIDSLNVKIQKTENEKNKQIEVYNIKFRELELKFDTVSKEYIKKFEDQNKEIEKLNNQKCAYENDYLKLEEKLKEKDKKIKDLETINDNINKQYDELENQKNAYENDYLKLEEKLKEREKQNENVCKFNKQDINDFCDNMLDFFKNHQL